jgi:hypothetical protein
MLDQDLVNSYKSNNLILFVGAGVSKNLNLPDWKELIAKIANELGYDEEVFSTYGDYLSLAEYYLLKNNNKIGKLRSWMDTNWHKSDVNFEDSIIYKTIANGDFPIIYTTNYDRWIEKSLEHYDKSHKVIVNVSDLTDIKSSQTQVVKFHGDFSDDSSIVLGESSYFDRLDFEGPLDIKFRSDVLGKSVLFIGYSLSDINIKILFYKLHKLWVKQGIHQRPKSFIFATNPNPIQEEILNERGVKMLFSEETNPGKALEAFLDELVKS